VDDALVGLPETNKGLLGEESKRTQISGPFAKEVFMPTFLLNEPPNRLIISV
jgi:hypothetical protein